MIFDVLKFRHISIKTNTNLYNKSPWIYCSNMLNFESFIMRLCFCPEKWTYLCTVNEPLDISTPNFPYKLLVPRGTFSHQVVCLKRSITENIEL